jgi:hypothetical protein
MDDVALERHIIAIAHNPDSLPPNELIKYASERNWLNTSRTNSAYNLSSGTHQGLARPIVFEINLLIVAGYLRDLYPEDIAESN